MFYIRKVYFLMHKLQEGEGLAEARREILCLAPGARDRDKVRKLAGCDKLGLVTRPCRGRVAKMDDLRSRAWVEGSPCRLS